MQDTPIQDNEPSIGDPTITSPVSEAPKTSNKKPLIIGGAVAILLVSVVLIVIFVILPTIKKNNSNPIEEEEVPMLEIDESQTTVYTSSEDRVAALKNNIAAAANEDARIVAILELVSYYASIEDYESAESTIAEISTDGLSTENLFRYYNVLSRVYPETRDPEKYQEYYQLAVHYRNLLQDEKFGQ